MSESYKCSCGRKFASKKELEAHIKKWIRIGAVPWRHFSVPLIESCTNEVQKEMKNNG